MASSAVNLVLRYIESSQRARREQTEEAWEAVRACLDEEVETRLAGGSGGETWVAYRGREERLRRLRRPDVAASRLETETTRSFGSEDGTVVVVEQISTSHRDDGTTISTPGCFIFEVADEKIVRISIYRNLA